MPALHGEWCQSGLIKVIIPGCNDALVRHQECRRVKVGRWGRLGRHRQWGGGAREREKGEGMEVHMKEVGMGWGFVVDGEGSQECIRKRVCRGG